MKQVALIILTILLLRSSSLVRSQYVDSCDNNDINFNDAANFDTTAMSCQIVWQKESFTLRYTQAGPGLWSFLLSAYNPSSWIAMGFSTNGQMKGSSAMVGWFYPNGTGKALQYDLKDKDSNSVIPHQGELTLVDNSSTVFMQSNRLYMAFQLSTPQPLPDLLYAIGPYTLPSDSNGLKLSHKNIGITILILSCLQIMALLVRPQKKLKIRKYWNWYHHNAGRILVILAISNIFYGIRLGLEGTSWYGTYAVIIAILFVSAIVLEFRLRRQR